MLDRHRHVRLVVEQRVEWFGDIGDQLKIGQLTKVAVELSQQRLQIDLLA